MSQTVEEKILVFLVEAFRKSKKDTGDNQNNRKTRLNPEKIYSKYRSNEGDFERITEINNVVKALSDKGFVVAETEKYGTMLKSICLVDERIIEIESFLSGKYGYVPKDAKIKAMEDLIHKYSNASTICYKECELLQEKLNARIVPKNIYELEDIFKGVAFIENNREDLFIREVSLKVYGDSKYFEEKTLEPISNLIRKYYDVPVEDGSYNGEILRTYHIYKEPQKISIKGEAVIRINEIDVDISGFSDGIEFAVDELNTIEKIIIKASSFMTIENRTSYLRYKPDDAVLLYLGGFVNRYQRDFIKIVFDCNPNVNYYHFGDIDAGGFWIHHNLCEVTGVRFELFSMSIKELMNPNYKGCLHELSKNDLIRMRELATIFEYQNVINYMIKHNIKLEQEIICLDLMGKM